MESGTAGQASKQHSRGTSGERELLGPPFNGAFSPLPLMHTMSRLMQGNKLEKVHVSCTCGIASLFLSLAVAFVPQPICKGFRISMKILVEFWPKFALCCTEVPSFVGAGGYGVIARAIRFPTTNPHSHKR
ncbi:hypothetical protein P167DRAFT_6873 [Morchella conica CCBAS932]|uniref:Uncharacterized protein n=1 Tax=Morchella conica CCBAS932 TaxID=1392247 RepID=A0A3N4LAJ0_9PEZI|nr:hypothetical protein P167DRAFT_6873 [Morchella conica CCBAS932]